MDNTNSFYYPWTTQSLNSNLPLANYKCDVTFRTFNEFYQLSRPTQFSNPLTYTNISFPSCHFLPWVHYMTHTENETTKRPKRTVTNREQQTCPFTNVHVFPKTFLKISSPTPPITASRKIHKQIQDTHSIKYLALRHFCPSDTTCQNINCFTSHFQYLIFRWKYSPTTCFYVQKWQLWVTKRNDYRPLI